jgi:outer membrane immunogenic protein
MKRVFLSGVALAALVGSAAAADLPRRPVQAAAPVPYVAPVFNWTGFYAGINGGWGWGTGSLSGPPPTGDMDGNGGEFGGQIGYNWQVNQFVFGVETDINWSGIEAERRCGGGGAIRCQVSNDWFGTARGRLGVAVDRWLPYITGGLAYGDVSASVTGNRGASETQAGWVLGAGIEYAFAPPWTARLEYLHVDLGDFACGRRCGTAGPDNVSFRSDIVRAGLNYKF